MKGEAEDGKGRGGNTRLSEELAKGHLRSGLDSSSAIPAAFPMNIRFLRICIHVRAIQSASYHERRCNSRTPLRFPIFSGLSEINPSSLPSVTVMPEK